MNFPPAAFDPFFDETVSVERPGFAATGAIPACVIDQGFDDPVDDGSVASSRRRFSVLVRHADWPFPEPPRAGDRVRLDSSSGVLDSELAIVSVSSSCGDFTMEARSC